MRALKSEFIKIKTLKSTWILAALTIFFMVAFATLMAVETQPGIEMPSQTIWGLTTLGTQIAQITLGLFAVLVITAEYSYSTILVSLLGVPKRWKVYLAKSILVAVFTFIVYAISNILSFFIATAFLKQNFEFDTWTVFTDHAGYGLGAQSIGMMLFALMCLGIGFIVKNSAAAISIFLGFILLVSSLIQIAATVIQADWIANIYQILPDVLMTKLGNTSLMGGASEFPSTVWNFTSVEAGIGLGIWAAVLLSVGYVLFSRRDV